MQRRPREISVFTISAIDLFACAMGAFILLSIALFQYYLKVEEPTDEPAPVAQDDPRTDELTRALASSEARVEELKSEVEKSRRLAFLGIVTKSKSFVVLIDTSGSMENYDRLVARTVGELLSQMNDAYKCQLIGFQGDAHDALRPTLTEWQPAGSLAPMTPANLASARDFARSLIGKFRSGTPTYLALQSALRYPAEAVFLLTDGAPTDVDHWSTIVYNITRENTAKKRIFCVAIGDYRADPALVEFLETLARSNGGKFLGVSE